jgi:hypothetical protein
MSAFRGTSGPESKLPDVPESMLLRDNETYTPYPTAARTASIKIFFSEPMFVLLDEACQDQEGRIIRRNGDRRYGSRGPTPRKSVTSWMV